MKDPQFNSEEDREDAIRELEELFASSQHVLLAALFDNSDVIKAMSTYISLTLQKQGRLKPLLEIEKQLFSKYSTEHLKGLHEAGILTEMFSPSVLVDAPVEVFDV